MAGIMVRNNSRARPAARKTSHRGARRKGRTTNPAMAYSTRMSPFQTRNMCTSPIASRTASRRTSRMKRRGSSASRSNWMARPTPNRNENSASALSSTAAVRNDFNTRSMAASAPPGGRNCSKIETRNSNTVLMTRTPSSASPRRMSMPSIRSDGAIGADDGSSVGRLAGNDRPRSLRVLQRDAEFGFGLRLDLVEGDAVGKLDQRHAVLAVLVDGEHRQIRDDHVDHAFARERQVALLEQLRAVLGGMLHDHDDALDAGDEVHGAAHALHHLAGNHPVGEIAVLRHLHRAEDGQINMPATHHREGIGRGEIAGRGQ